MAKFYVCDGCNTGVADPKKVGDVIERDYCEACAAKAKAFMEAEEMLRKNAQETFVGARSRLIETSKAGGFKLPDVP